MHLAKEERYQLLQLKQKLEEELKELEKRRDAYNEQEKVLRSIQPGFPLTPSAAGSYPQGLAGLCDRTGQFGLQLSLKGHRSL